MARPWTAKHAQIAEEIIRLLRQARPDENLNGLGFGNWLTDLSQFREPTPIAGPQGGQLVAWFREATL